MERTAKIINLEQLKALEGDLYVRWSNSIKRDTARGYSLRCGTSAESGLSACKIERDWSDWRILRQLMEYRFTGAAHCWIITGRESGVGGDNEPLLRDVTVLAEIGDEIKSVNWRAMKLEEEIAKDEDRLTRITSESARRITVSALAKNREELRKVTS